MSINRIAIQAASNAGGDAYYVYNYTHTTAYSHRSSTFAVDSQKNIILCGISSGDFRVTQLKHDEEGAEIFDKSYVYNGTDVPRGEMQLFTDSSDNIYYTFVTQREAVSSSYYTGVEKQSPSGVRQYFKYYYQSGLIYHKLAFADDSIIYVQNGYGQYRMLSTANALSVNNRDDTRVNTYTHRRTSDLQNANPMFYNGSRYKAVGDILDATSRKIAIVPYTGSLTISGTTYVISGGNGLTPVDCAFKNNALVITSIIYTGGVNRPCITFGTETSLTAAKVITNVSANTGTPSFCQIDDNGYVYQCLNDKDTKYLYIIKYDSSGNVVFTNRIPNFYCWKFLVKNNAMYILGINYNTFEGSILFKLPLDGSGLGTYYGFTYESTSTLSYTSDSFSMQTGSATDNVRSADTYQNLVYGDSTPAYSISTTQIL